MFKVRQLQLRDAFKISSLARKAGVQSLAELYNSSVKEAKTIENEEQRKEFMNAKGALYIEAVLAGLENCENDLYSFLASLCNEEVKKVQELTFVEFKTLIDEILEVNKPEELIAFFTQVFSTVQRVR